MLMEEPEDHPNLGKTHRTLRATSGLAQLQFEVHEGPVTYLTLKALRIMAAARDMLSWIVEWPTQLRGFLFTIMTILSKTFGNTLRHVCKYTASPGPTRLGHKTRVPLRSSKSAPSIPALVVGDMSWHCMKSLILKLWTAACF